MRIVEVGNRRPQSRLQRHRFGLAPLEMVMCLPVIVLLFICIIWAGTYLVAQSEVTVEARNRTWKKRSGNRPPAFDFGSPGQLAESATKAVRVSPIFNAVPHPRSTHVVLGGSWDYPQVDLDKKPNWDRFKELGGLAVKGGLSRINDVLGKLNGLGGRLSSEIEAFEELVKFDRILSLGGSSMTKIQDKRREKLRELEQEKRQLRAEVNELKQQHAVLDEQVASLQRQIEGIERRLRQDDSAPKEGKLTPEKRRELEEKRDRISKTELPAKRKERDRVRNLLRRQEGVLENVQGVGDGA